MRRLFRWLIATPLVIVAAGAATLSFWHLLDATPTPAVAKTATSRFDISRLLVLADADMAATAYADGQLHPIADAVDTLIVLADPGAQAPVRRDIAAPNSVMGWPGAMTTDAVGRFAYVIESRGTIGREVAAVESVNTGMPVGTLTTTIDLLSGVVFAKTETCPNPGSIDIAPSGAWLMVVCGDASSELAVIPLSDGQPGEVRRFDLDLPDIKQRAMDDGLTYGVIHPGGAAAGVVQGNVGVTLVRFKLDAGGIPHEATAEQPVQTDGWFTVGRWTASGNHFLVADVGWGAARTDAVLNGPGAILLLALSPDTEARGVVSTAQVSKSPEAFEINRDGSLLVAVNMERAYLPDGFLSMVPGRGASSLSLVAVDDATGELRTLGDPVGFRGVLPEDAVFDRDGDDLAVVVYQDHDAPHSGGWVEFFAVQSGEGDPRLVPTGQRIALPRGTHDLFALD